MDPIIKMPNPKTLIPKTNAIKTPSIGKAKNAIE